MESSLSIIVAAHNAQHTIEHRVADLLEVAADLTPRVELLVVDDGSVDGTEEVAYELTRLYPQVRLVRHDTQRGVAEAIRTGMQHTGGEVVLVQEESMPVRASDVRRLWALRSDQDVLVARTDPGPEPMDPGLLQRLMAWGAKVRQTSREQRQGGLRMIRRQAVQQTGDRLDYELSRIEQPAPPAAPVRSPNYLDHSRQTQS